MNKIVIDRKLLIDRLQKVIGPTTGKTTFPIFSTALIEITNRKIRFTTTDLELTMISEIEAASAQTTTFCVSVAKFLAILKEFSAETVSLDIQKTFLWITCGKCELKLHIVSAEEFPKVPVFKDTPVIKIPSSTLKEMIALTSFSVFVGEGNYVLNGILCELEADTIKLVSTDGKDFLWLLEKSQKNRRL